MELNYRKCGTGLLASFVLLAVMAPVMAADYTGIDRQAFAKEIEQMILRDLHDSGALRKAARQGIEDLIAERREAQAKAGAEQRRAEAARARTVRPVSAARDHIFGNPDAEVSLIEYSDLECPYCKRFHVTARALVKRYAGRVNWVYRQFPLSFHANAGIEAQASECAAALGGDKAFWPFIDAIFERTQSNGYGFARDALVPLAAAIGLDATRFKSCLDTGEQSARVREDARDGAAVGVTGTPGNIILNNRTGKAMLREGAVPLDRLMTDVERILATDGRETVSGGQ